MSERGQRTQRAIDEAVVALQRALYLDIDEAYDDGFNDDGYCDRDHCDDGDCSPWGEAQTTDSVEAVVDYYLWQIRMGYTIEVSLEDVLLELKEELK